MVANTPRPRVVLTLWLWALWCCAPCWCTSINASDLPAILVAPPKPVTSAPQTNATTEAPTSSVPRSTSSTTVMSPTIVTHPTTDPSGAPPVTSLPPLSLELSSPDVVPCWTEMECDAISEWGPPPELVPFLPPPPMPAFLLNSIEMYKDPDAGSDADEDSCILCEWANRENDTTEVQASTAAPSKGISEEMTWISILIVASLASAAVGAIFMIVLLKCKKFKILPMTDSCPILPDSYFGSKSNQNSSCHERPAEDSSAATTPSSETLAGKPEPKLRAPNGGGWSFWRRSSASTERPLRSSSSMCSEENSYSEEPYIVSEHSSTLYAELNSVSQDGSAPYRTYSMNTYSEVSDPGGKLQRRLISDGTYENAAYVISENGDDGAPAPSQPESDGVDTPSSAYYSDSSNQTNGRKRKKKQQRPLDDRFGSGLETLALDSLPADAVVYFPPDYGSRFVRAGQDPGGPIVAQPSLDRSGRGMSFKRPLPPAPPTAPQQTPPPSEGLRSSIVRPLPPVPSQYV